MNAPETLNLPDIQSIADHRALPITRVGIKGLVHPIEIQTPDGEIQHTIASAEMSVGLRADVKGTHMSRFIEVLQAHRDSFDARGIRRLLERTLERLDATTGRVELSFPYFISKRAPVSGVESLLDYDVTLRGDMDRPNRYTFSLTVTAPVTSLCPCSKEISAYGAHNQRSHITIRAQTLADLSIEELVEVAEQEASCPIFGLLKRPDEKWVTERAYDNPKFVEDLVRDIALRLNRDDRIVAYRVASENFESIHNHSAYAVIEHDKRRIP